MHLHLRNIDMSIIQGSAEEEGRSISPPSVVWTASFHRYQAHLHWIPSADLGPHWTYLASRTPAGILWRSYGSTAWTSPYVFLSIVNGSLLLLLPLVGIFHGCGRFSRNTKRVPRKPRNLQGGTASEIRCDVNGLATRACGLWLLSCISRLHLVLAYHLDPNHKGSAPQKPVGEHAASYCTAATRGRIATGIRDCFASLYCRPTIVCSAFKSLPASALEHLHDAKRR